MEQCYSHTMSIHESETSGEFLMVHERINSSNSLAVSDVFQPEIVLRQSGVLPSKLTDTENEVFQSEIERKIKKLFEEFDMMSVHEYDLTRVKKVKQLFKKYQTDNQKEHILEEGLEEKSNELAKVEEEFQHFLDEMEKDIAKLFEELDMMSRYKHDQMRVRKVKQLVEKYQRWDVLQGQAHEQRQSI